MTKWIEMPGCAPPVGVEDEPSTVPELDSPFTTVQQGPLTVDAGLTLKFSDPGKMIIMQRADGAFEIGEAVVVPKHLWDKLGKELKMYREDQPTKYNINHLNTASLTTPRAKCLKSGYHILCDDHNGATLTGLPIKHD